MGGGRIVVERRVSGIRGMRGGASMEKDRRAIGEDVVGLRVVSALRSILTVCRDTLSSRSLSHGFANSRMRCLLYSARLASES